MPFNCDFWANGIPNVSIRQNTNTEMTRQAESEIEKDAEHNFIVIFYCAVYIDTIMCIILFTEYLPSNFILFFCPTADYL